jgi:predicted nucleic acid binding AN1-type Zn finger protein
MQLDPSLTVISLPQVAGQCMPCAQCGRSSSITSECDACAAPYFPADDAGAACSAEEGQGGTRGAYIHVVAAVYAQEQLPFSYLVRKPSICEREREREREREAWLHPTRTGDPNGAARVCSRTCEGIQSGFTGSFEFNSESSRVSTGSSKLNWN